MAMWSGIVGNAAEALGHPALSSAIRKLHPGVMKAGIAAPTGYADGGAVDPAASGIGAAPGGPPDPAAGAPQQFDPNDPQKQAQALELLRQAR